jgi:fused signal recognition particle receptor
VEEATEPAPATEEATAEVIPSEVHALKEERTEEISAPAASSPEPEIRPAPEPEVIAPEPEPEGPEPTAPQPEPVTEKAPSLKEKITGIFKREKKEPEKAPEKRELAPKLTIATKLKKAVLRRATIRDADVESLLSDLDLALLEADVAVPVAQALCDDIKTRLVGREISGRDDIRKLSKDAVKESLRDILKQEKVDIISKAKAKKPYVVLFLGPNGHGKSTTIGKFASFLRANGLSSVISASDTFRAASIEQIETIANRANVRVIKQKYGADPAAVAFDAIEHAKAHDIDAVLIDTAGRSELNVNLMEQMRKIVRVAKPDLKIYVAEALAGNAAVEEASKFNEVAGLDGIIVTKVDCDVKGGSLLSMSHVTKKPVMFIGTGQGIDDLKPFEPEWFIERVLGD